MYLIGILVYTQFLVRKISYQSLLNIHFKSVMIKHSTLKSICKPPILNLSYSRWMTVSNPFIWPLPSIDEKEKHLTLNVPLSILIYMEKLKQIATKKYNDSRWKNMHNADIIELELQWLHFTHKKSCLLVHKAQLKPILVTRTHTQALEGESICHRTISHYRLH